MTTTFSKYQETLGGCDVDLSDNTNLWGAAPSVGRVLASVAPAELSRYPAAYSPNLKRSISRYTGVDESMIVTGCGSDDVLDSAIRAFGGRGDLLVQADPTFSMIPVFSAVSRVTVQAISPFQPDFASLVTAAKARITYLCSPNNPTGGVFEAETIESIARNARGLVIIDEAYIEFGGTSSVGLLSKLDNVLVTRTFSKAFGLAGFRVGYGLASAKIAERIESARGPYKVTALSERVASTVMDNDSDWVKECVARTIENRQRFTEELTKIGLPPLDSGANFVMVPVTNGEKFEDECRKAGVAVRRFNALTGIGDALRISIGPWDMMQRCLDALGGIAR